ncbi:terminase small subunit [Weissella koreensis]|uniref:terminase small subunit n=1 Tax=Weissella koreensis TaxID=165096 RepID=UPI0022BA302B|nr:terminase small subunit [Weissella koreensis]MCZ9310619.1 terminase small subunit [Weissella koreensis]
MTETWEEAEQDYLAGMKYKDIATKYEVSVSNVKAWKSRKWVKEKVTNKNVTKTEKVTKKSQKVTTQNNVDDVIDDLDEYGLTDKQNVFVVRYLKSFNATQAYMDAYGVDANTARTNGSRLLTNANIRSAIKRIKAARLKDVAVDEEDIIAQWARQSFADIGDYVEFGTHPEQIMAAYGPMFHDGEPVMQDRSRIYLKNKDDVDTSLIKKITVGKDGPIVELFDKTKAQERLLEEIRAMDRPNENNDSSLINAIGKAVEGAFDEDETET